MKAPFHDALKAGVLGAVVVIFAAMTGMIENFDGLNLIGEQVTLALVLMGVPPLIAAYVATRPRLVAAGIRGLVPRTAALAGLVTGLTTSVVVSAALGVVELLGVDRIRPVFTSVSPTLIEIMQFGKGWAAGSAILIAGGAVLGLIGGASRGVAARIRRPVVIGFGVTLVMALLQRIVPTILFELGTESDWLYSPVTLGLTWLGAILVFVVSARATALWSARGQNLRDRVEGMEQGRRATRAVVLAALVLGLIALPQLAGSIISEILGSVGIYVLLGLGLNIVVGYSGLLDLGYVAFFSVGAYFLALLTGASLVAVLGTAEPAFSADLGFYGAVPLVVLIAAFVGVMIGGPVLRLRGDYLAIVTLGFGEIARVLVTSEWLKPLVGGAQGMRNVTPATILGYDFRDPQHFYYLVLAFCLAAVYVSVRLAGSRVGRAWNAMREDEQVAEATGVSTVKYKLLAFAMGGAIGCLGGALFAVKVGTVQPDSFTILVSITALAVVVLGGMGSVPGVVVGALVLIGLPGLLSQLEQYRLLIYGAVLVAIMILRPQGLIPNVRRMRELREEERAQDAWARGEAGEPATVGAEAEGA